jgi:hypothetical protein
MWIRDSRRHGCPDRWSVFKDGRGFIEEEDRDHDGKVDYILFSLSESQGIKQRYVLLVQKGNIFQLQADTDWVTEEEFSKMK